MYIIVTINTILYIKEVYSPIRLSYNIKDNLYYFMSCFCCGQVSRYAQLLKYIVSFEVNLEENAI